MRSCQSTIILQRIPKRLKTKIHQIRNFVKIVLTPAIRTEYQPGGTFRHRIVIFKVFS